MLREGVVDKNWNVKIIKSFDIWNAIHHSTNQNWRLPAMRDEALYHEGDLRPLLLLHTIAREGQFDFPTPPSRPVKVWRSMDWAGWRGRIIVLQTIQ